MSVSAFYTELFQSAKKQEGRLKKLEQWKTTMRQAAREGSYSIRLSCDETFTSDLAKQGFIVRLSGDAGCWEISWEKEKV